MVPDYLLPVNGDVWELIVKRAGNNEWCHYLQLVALIKADPHYFGPRIRAAFDNWFHRLIYDDLNEEEKWIVYPLGPPGTARSGGIAWVLYY